MSGKVTRGKTAPGRLEALDRWLRRHEAALLSRDQGPWGQAAFVDIGFGQRPWTTLEAAACFSQLNPQLHTVGTELDPARVEAAAPHQSERVRFLQADFALDQVLTRPARLVRAMNVLRQYAPWDIDQAHREMGRALLPGGLLVEGTCDKAGDRLVVHLLRRQQEGLRREGLLFYTSFAHGFAPMQLRDYLPRDLRRSVVPGSPMAAFFQDWTQAWAQVRAGREPAEAFELAAQGLARRRPGVCAAPWMWRGGYLLWTPQGGVPPGQGAGGR